MACILYLSVFFKTFLFLLCSVCLSLGSFFYMFIVNIFGPIMTTFCIYSSLLSVRPALKYRQIRGTFFWNDKRNI